jgi:hypothetical protein
LEKRLFHRRSDRVVDALFQCGDVLLGQAFGFDGVVNVDGDGGGAEEPVAGAEMVERADEADGDDGNAELLG